MLQKAPVYAYAPASDVARARKFYEKQLGFKPGKEIGGGVSYECANGTSFFLYPSAGAGTNKASTLFWVVADVEKEVAELRERGVKFEEYDMPGIKTVNGIVKTPEGGRAAWFKDTEGNIMAIASET
jgi:predicted enzyme related to lactoylglutathione lyase